MKRIAILAAIALVATAGVAFAQPVMEVTGGNVVIPSTTSKLGVGTDNPAFQLHLKNTGQPTFQFEQVGNTPYNFKINGIGQFTIGKQGESPPAFKILGLGGPNQVIIGGGIQATAFNTASSRALKENFEAVDGREMLTLVTEMPISRWNYIADEADTPRIGPMAEDFHAAFAVGNTDKAISTSDMGGIALAAIQGLNEEVEAKDELIQDLLQRVEQLEQRLNER